MATPIFKAAPWRGNKPPRKILVMRFQALGDLIITLPYLQDLKNHLPDTDFHLLTRKEMSSIPLQLTMFSKVILIGGQRSMKLQLFLSLLQMPWLWWQRYDVVIDLQNHRLSRIIRWLLNASSWSQFDRSSFVLAGERTQAAIDNIGLIPVAIEPNIHIKSDFKFTDHWKSKGLQDDKLIIILNPAGGFESRNWPIQNYIDFAKLWIAKEPTAQFVIIGLPSMAAKAALLKKELGEYLVDLIGETTAFEAYQIIRKAKLVLSEDSGLMHMAWTQGIPTIAIFGSTPSFWSAPIGAWTYCFNSSDLPCGNCFAEKCKYGDNHCLTRWTAAVVFGKGVEILKNWNIGILKY